MNIQHAPLRSTQELSKALNEIDAAIGESKGLASRHSENNRNAITACVDGLVTNQSDKVEALRKMLDVIQQRALQSAAKAKAALEEHVAVTDRLHDQIFHLQDAIADLMEQTNAAQT